MRINLSLNLMSMEMPQPVPQQNKPEKNPLQKRLADAKGERELRNAFEALGEAGELQARFDKAVSDLEKLTTDASWEVKAWALKSLDQLSDVIDKLAIEKDQKKVNELVGFAKHILRDVEEYPARKARQDALDFEERLKKARQEAAGPSEDPLL